MQVNNVETLFQKTLQKSDLTAKQQAVLSVSLNLFAAQGFDRTSTSEIAQAAGVSEGTVFKQFKTKDGILRAIIDPVLDQVIPMAATEFMTEIDAAKITDFESFLSYVLEDRMTFALENQQQIKVFAQEILRQPSLIQALLNKVQTLVTSKVGDIFRNFQASGQLVDWPVSQIARYIVGTIVSYVLPQILFQLDTNFDVKQASHDAAKFLARGLAPEK